MIYKWCPNNNNFKKMWEIILKTYYYDLFVFNYYTCQTAIVIIIY